METSGSPTNQTENVYAFKRENNDEASCYSNGTGNAMSSFKLPTPQDIQRQLWQIQQQVGLVAPDSSTSPSSSQTGHFDMANSILNWNSTASTALSSPFFDPDSIWKLRNLQLIQANLISLQESLNATLQEANALIRSDYVGDSMIIDGVCQWPGCNAIVTDELETSHMCLTHGLDFNSIGQVRVQMQCVRSLEGALAKEKSRLAGMVTHLRDNSFSLSTSGPPPLQNNTNGVLNLSTGYPSSGGSIGPIRPRGRPTEKTSTPIGGDLTKNREFYNSNDIRPPFTYASLIRQAIAEAPNMQLTLNEIYIWFQRNFAYFRRNEATWKNAVRHNLSLHKCFTRVENVKGAVWTVDEHEFSSRRSQRIISVTKMEPLEQQEYQNVFEAGNDGSTDLPPETAGLAINLSLGEGSDTASVKSSNIPLGDDMETYPGEENTSPNDQKEQDSYL